LLDDSCDFVLVRRIHPAEQQTDGDGFDLLLFHEFPYRGAYTLDIERDDHIAFVVDTFVDPADGLARHQGGRFRHLGDVLDLHLVETIDPADRTHHVYGIFEATGGDQADLGTAPDDERVRRHGRTVLEHAGAFEKPLRIHAQRFCRRRDG